VTARHVYVVHTEDGLCEEVVKFMASEWPMVRYALTTKRSPFSYGDVLRTLWRERGADIVICEQDAVPHPGSLVELFDCEQPWCTCPHWTGETYQLDSLGLVKFSDDLRDACPWLCDVVCTKADVRYWVRRGWTNIPRDCSVATLNGPGRRAAITHNAGLFTQVSHPAVRPTTHDWMGLDTDMSRALRQLGYRPHVHRHPTNHLHDYKAAPKDNHMPWHQRPYDPAEWEQ